MGGISVAWGAQSIRTPTRKNDPCVCSIAQRVLKPIRGKCTEQGLRSSRALVSGDWGVGLTFTHGNLYETRLPPLRRRRSGPGRAAKTVALFTGIVQGQANITHKEARNSTFTTLTAQFPSGALTGIQIGASVAINGTCLTVTDIDESASTLSFDLIIETLRATNLGYLREGDFCNYERSARFGEEVGGHIVSGHVHTTALVSEIEETENNRKVTYTLVNKELWMKYIMPKGFISLDGCSLTVGEVGADWFTVYYIPETLRVTMHGKRMVGDTVNVEIESQTQTIVDTVEKYLSEKSIRP